MKREPKSSIIFLICDLVLLSVNFYLTNKSLVHNVIFVFVGCATFSLCSFYYDIPRKSRLKELPNILVATILFYIICNILSHFSSIPVSVNFIYLATELLLIKMILMWFIKNMIFNGTITFNTLIVGNHELTNSIYTEILNLETKIGWKVKKIYSPTDINILDTANQIEQIIIKDNIKEIVLCFKENEETQFFNIYQMLNNYDLNINIVPNIKSLLIGKFELNHIFKQPLIIIRSNSTPYWQQNIKQVIDLTVSIFMLIFCLPFFIMISLIIKLTSKGPIFFIQERIGKNGKPFIMYKFRSMYLNAENNGPKLISKNDKRITPWGAFMRKTRIDELPQFYNVLIGDMSLVGPRPERQFYIDQIVKVAPNFKLRQKVKPGITSLAQVKYGYAENVDEMIKRLKYDIFYIKNMSLYLDFVIIYLTIITVLRAEGK